MKSPSLLKTEKDTAFNANRNHRYGGTIVSLALEQVLLVFYFYLIFGQYMYGKIQGITRSLLSSVQRYVPMIQSYVESALEFSKNVRHYVTLLRKVCEYRMYKNVN